MKKYFLYIFLGASLALVSPAVWAKTDSEKLQNKIDNYENALGDFIDALTDADSLQLPDEELAEGEEAPTLDEENAELAQMKYNASAPVLEDVLEEIQNIKTVTRYLYGIPKKDTHAIRVSLESMTAQLSIYGSDLNAGLELVNTTTEEENSADEGLADIETAIGDARSYLSSNKRLFHDTLEKYLYNALNAKKSNYEYTLEKIDSTYDLYEESLGESVVATLKTYHVNANSAYSEGVALYNKGVDGSEKRDLQLLNRSANKMLAVRQWISSAYNEIADLES